MDLTVMDELVFIVPALWCVGYWLKSTPNVKDWIIPYLLCLLSIAGSIMTVGFSVEAVANGVIAVGLAVFGNQLVKQAKNVE